MYHAYAMRKLPPGRKKNNAKPLEKQPLKGEKTRKNAK